MIQQTVSKSQFKAQALEYLRLVQTQKQPLIITHAGNPVVEVVPYKEEDADKTILKSLKGSVLYYKDPDEPAIDLQDWEMLK